MWTVIQEALRILSMAAPYLLFGYLAAGLLSVLLSRYQRINSLLAAPGGRPVILAALIGVPMPLCSCSVLPTALALRRQGASKGTTASFLISVPETDIISIILTYALLGPLFAVFRPLAAVITAVVTGLVINRVDSDNADQTKNNHQDTKGHSSRPKDDAPSCCKNGQCDDAGTSDSTTAQPGAPPEKKRGWLARALHFGFVEMFDDIMVQLLIGILLAGAVVAWLPGFGLENVVGGSPFTYLVMLIIGIPVYVCATASTPLAVGLIAAGVSPGAALVFLLAGPATNIASLIVLHSQFGRRVLGAYLACIAVVSIFMGVWLDAILGPDFRSAVVHTGPLMNGGASILEIVSTVLILLLAVISMRRTRVLERWTSSINRRFKLSIGSKTLKMAIVFFILLSYLLSGFFTIEPGERGAIKTFGRITSAYLQPGLHYHWPVPFGRADVESVRKIRRLEIGFQSEPAVSGFAIVENTTDELDSSTWMLAGDENIVDIRCVLHYQIIDTLDAFLDYLYGIKDKNELVGGAAEWALRTAVAGRSIDSLLTVDRDVVEKTVSNELLQPRLDACRAGVRVVDVTLQSVHAPPPVHWAFRDVASAAEDQKQKENLAQEYWEKTTLEAEGEAARSLAVATGKAAEHVNGARGAAHAFEAQSAAYLEGPQVMETRLYLEWLDRVLPEMNKYVDLMPHKAGGSEVWLRMGPEAAPVPVEQPEQWPFPWDRQQEEKK
ncbi:MAG: SO_0444 family Cu/Zn efflux transporter [Candidatus Latescibacterota bacterium]|nr:MAG: SO_0444 family Cu/Zn efflux transporter [Candidatus Latescibacterota bacterium]